MHDLTERCSVMVLTSFNNLNKVFLFTTTFVYLDSSRFGSVVQRFHFLMAVSPFCAFRFFYLWTKILTSDTLVSSVVISDAAHLGFRPFGHLPV